MASFRSGIKILCECTKLQARNTLRTRSLSNGSATQNNSLLPINFAGTPKFLTTKWSSVTDQSLLTTCRFYSDSKNDPNKGAPRCAPKPTIKKSELCTPIKFPGCEPRVVPDCAVIKSREKCVKLEAPYPSYSECTREPTPPHRPTECPRTVRSPQEHCIPENLGITIDGCNPPGPKSLVCPDKSNRAAVKRKNISCDLPDDECDPNFKPYKNASKNTSSAIKCPSSSTSGATFKITDPMSQPKHCFTAMRFYSDSKNDEKGAPRCPPKPSIKKGEFCPPMKFPGCEPRFVPDCAVIKPREKCVKLEAPYPSYSECTREPTPPPRPTECARTVRSPQAHCILENLGITIDGCNPPGPKTLVCPDKAKRAVIKRKNISCDLPDDECDPNFKPYKNASTSSSSPMKCPSSSMYTKVCEPMSGPKQFLPSSRSYSVKSKKPQEICSKMPEKSSEKVDYTSPVSCLARASKMASKSSCETDFCAKIDSWKVCPKPPVINSYRCPVKVKKTKKLAKLKVVKCKKSYRECPCPPPPVGPKCIEPEVVVEAPIPKCCIVKKVVIDCPCPQYKSPCDVVKKVEIKNQQKRCVCGPKVTAAAILKQSCSRKSKKSSMLPDCNRSASGLTAKTVSKPKP